MAWEEVLDITPGMFLALINRRKYTNAVWIATYANMKRGKDQPIIQPEDLMPKAGRKTKVGLGPEVFAACQRAAAVMNG